jgi:hypothetical protein
MKNKTFTFILIAVVGFVWFKVFVRISSNISSDLPTPPQQRVLSNLKKITQPQAFELKANYRDPFSGCMGEKKAVSNTSINNLPPKPAPLIKERIPVYWPSIKYYGFVRNTTSSTPRILVSIDGSMYKLKIKDKVLDDIEVLSATRDDLKMKYKGEIRVFGK